jgi:branched-chain amino acid transport system substrate-binding protein
LPCCLKKGYSVIDQSDRPPAEDFSSIVSLEDAFMKTMTKRTIYLFLAVFLLTGVTGCDKDQNCVTPASVKVGALFPLSGDLRDKGVDSANGVRLAAEEINSHGGIAALGGARLEIIYADTRGRPEAGVKETERLIQEEGVVAVIGTYQSSVTIPAAQISERLETPFIVSISIADIITERGFRYTFRIQPKASFYARDQVQFLKDLEKLAGYPVKRVALLHENTAFGTSAALAQRRALIEQGLEMAAEVVYRAEGVADLHKEVNQVLAARPDIILTVTYLTDSILIRKALAKSGTTVPMVDMAGGTVSPEYIQALGPLAEGTLTMAEYSKFAAGGKDLNERFHARFGVDITGDSAHAYQAVLVLKDALERAGALDRERLREALAATDMGQGPQLALPADRLRFDKSGQNEFAQLYVVQIQGGELAPVWPARYATAKVRINN